MNGTQSGFTTQDLGDVITAGNDIALQWYALTHQTTIPTRNPGIYTPLPGGGFVSANPNVLVFLVLGVVALIVFSK
jgi:hypothetical protein